MTRHIDLFGLTFATEIDVPWAAAAADPGAPDVVIRRAPLPGDPAQDGGSLQFEVPGIARYRISGGREIVVDPAAGASDEDLRLYLLGSALGVLLHQRGLLVLHANAIVVDGAAILFMGPSGAGKSSLAGWFAARGFTVLSDDVCALDLAGDRVMVLPGLARLRLDGAAADRLGFDTGGAPLCPTSGKHELGLPRRAALAAVPLRACYLLAGEDGARPVSIRALAGLDAVEMLMANTYRGFALQRLGGSGGHMNACLRAAAAAPCFEARRAKDWAGFDAVAEALLAHGRERAALERPGGAST